MKIFWIITMKDGFISITHFDHEEKYFVVLRQLISSNLSEMDDDKKKEIRKVLNRGLCHIHADNAWDLFKEYYEGPKDFQRGEVRLSAVITEE